MTFQSRERVEHLLRKWNFHHDQADTEGRDRTFWRTLAEYWLRFARMVGKANAILLLTVVYFVIIGPGAILLKLLRKDILDRRAEVRESYWYDKVPEDQGLDQSKHQF
jgi:hypothetical protein